MGGRLPLPGCCIVPGPKPEPTLIQCIAWVTPTATVPRVLPEGARYHIAMGSPRRFDALGLWRRV